MRLESNQRAIKLSRTGKLRNWEPTFINSFTRSHGFKLEKKSILQFLHPSNKMALKERRKKRVEPSKLSSFATFSQGIWDIKQLCCFAISIEYLQSVTFQLFPIQLRKSQNGCRQQSHSQLRRDQARVVQDHTKKGIHRNKTFSIVFSFHFENSMLIVGCVTSKTFLLLLCVKVLL